MLSWCVLFPTALEVVLEVVHSSLVAPGHEVAHSSLVAPGQAVQRIGPFVLGEIARATSPTAQNRLQS